MGGKRKVKEKEKIVKKENPKSKNQILLQHYFPNLCENKSKTYQNALKKPNGVMKEEKKLNKELFIEETLIIKEINCLFRGIFKEADHELINELAEMVIEKEGIDKKEIKEVSDSLMIEHDGKCQKKVEDKLLEDSLAESTHKEEDDAESESTETIRDLKEEKEMMGENCESQCHSFLMDLNEFQYNPNNVFSQKEREKECYTDEYQTKEESLEDFAITNQKVVSMIENDNASYQETLRKETSIENQNDYSNDAFFTEMEEKKTEKIIEISETLKNAIKNILNLISKKEQIKQEGISFKKFINQLKKEENEFHQENHTSFNAQKFSEENETDHDEMVFETIDFNLDKNIQSDVLDFILHRNYFSKSESPQNVNQMSKEIYHKHQDLLIKRIIDDENSTNEKSKTQMESSFDFDTEIQYKNQNLSEPSFDLPSEFLVGYSKEKMDSSFFRNIHEWETEKIKCIQTIEETLI